VPAVEVHAGGDAVGIVAGGEEAQRAAHAEADGADLRRRHPGLGGEIVDGAGEIALGLVDAHRHHHLSRLVRRRRGAAVIEVGRERDESFFREAIRDLLDVRNQSPPFLDDDDAGPGRLRPREISGGRGAVRFESHAFAHDAISCWSD
jgi:hypothetical protein